MMRFPSMMSRGDRDHHLCSHCTPRSIRRRIGKRQRARENRAWRTQETT